MKNHVSYFFSHKGNGMNGRFLLTLSVFITLLLPGKVVAQSDAGQSRMDRSRLNIGAYILQPYARTEQHVKDIADCGIDFMTCVQNDRAMLDLFRKYHVGAIVSGVVPGWWGGDGDNAGQLSKRNPMSSYEKAATGRMPPVR